MNVKPGDIAKIIPPNRDDPNTGRQVFVECFCPEYTGDVWWRVEALEPVWSQPHIGGPRILRPPGHRAAVRDRDLRRVGDPDIEDKAETSAGRKEKQS